MRRSAAALALAAVLLGACGRSDLSSETAQDLQRRVAEIRAAAEASRPFAARSRLQALTAEVAALVDQGLITEQRALDIVEAADAVNAQLNLLSAASPTPTPSPSVEEDPGGEGQGHDKDKDKGNEGQGNGD